MKKEVQKFLLKEISTLADKLVEGKVSWHGKEAVETAIMEWISCDVIPSVGSCPEEEITEFSNMLVEMYLPSEGPIKSVAEIMGWEKPTPKFIKSKNGRRLVQAAIIAQHTYHPECVINETEVWIELKYVSTHHSCCHRCGEALYKKPRPSENK